MGNTAKPFIIDVEASGFGPHSYPIEVGLALSEGERFSTLILPASDWTHWDASAESVHNIPREILLAHGKPMHEVTAQLNRLLAGKTVYSDGWVVDKPWLTTLFHAARTSMDFFVSPLELILSERQMELWHETKDLVLSEMQLKRHRASSDALIIQETYRRTHELAN